MVVWICVLNQWSRSYCVTTLDGCVTREHVHHVSAHASPTTELNHDDIIETLAPTVS